MVTFRPSSPRRLVRLATVAVIGSALVASTWVAPATGAVSPGTPSPCPDAFPTDELVAGQPLTGLTVERGTEPEPFEATVVGTLNDGIAPGLDMILVEATSPAIDRYGIWAGMSGSPLYTEDGRLVGAVSYGLAFGSSPVAGVTPADEMYRIRLNPSAMAAFEAQAREEIDVPRSLLKEMSRDARSSVASSDTGLRILPLPMGVSGMSPARAERLLTRIGSDIDLSLAYRSGFTPASASTPPMPPVPGGNAAVALAYGDTTIASTGTVTAVCGDDVLMFGHPMMWRGKTTLSLHAAEALLVQEDLAVPFKVANAQGVVGTVTQDRLAGLQATVARVPKTAPLTVEFAKPESGFRMSSVIRSVDPELTADIAASHVLAVSDRVVDAQGDGWSKFRWSASGRTSSGKKWTVNRIDGVSTRYDLSLDNGWLIFQALQGLLDARNTTVTIDSLRLKGTVDEDFERLRMKKVQIRSKGRWIPIQNQPVVRAGKKIRARVVTVNLADDTRVVKYTTLPALGNGTWRVSVKGGHGKHWRFRGSFEERLDTLKRAPSAVKADVKLQKRGRTKRDTIVFPRSIAGKQSGVIRARR